MVNFIASSRYKIDKQLLQEFMYSLLGKYNISVTKDINVVFVGRRKMKDIASTYKHENIALPVLAFPYTQTSEHSIAPEDEPLGEIILCYPEVVLLAAEKNKKLNIMISQLMEHGLKNIISNSSTKYVLS